MPSFLKFWKLVPIATEVTKRIFKKILPNSRATKIIIKTDNVVDTIDNVIGLKSKND